MLELRDFAGLGGLGLDGVELVLGPGLKISAMAKRSLSQMKDVLLDQSVDRPEDFYLMYRDVRREEDEELIKAYNYRYDLTVIRPGVVGKEFMKTYGHKHPEAEPGFSFPEVYEVIHGEAHYLLQSHSKAIVLKAVAGDKVLIPPNFGHITINPGSEPLVMSNWVERKFASDYSIYKEKRGAVFFETAEGWQPNRKYANIPELEELKPRRIPEFGIEGKPLYLSCIDEPQKFDFLKKPSAHAKIFEEYLAAAKPLPLK